MIRLSARVQAILPTQIRKLASLAKPTSLHLGIGQPNLPFPDSVRDALIEFANTKYAPYTPNAGLVSARSAIAKFSDSKRRTSEVLITTGVQEALALCILAIAEKGDEVLVPNPGFPAYPNLVRAAEAHPVGYNLDEKWQLDLEDIIAKVSKNTRAIIINSPGNPTGTMLSRQSLVELEKVCSQRKITIISDEIYSKFVYGKAPFYSMGEFVDRGHIVVNGLSKIGAMMGFRIGWVEANASFIRSIIPLHQHLVTSASSVSQYAAIAAVESIHENSIPQQMWQRFDRAMELATHFVKKQDIRTPIVADSAFYIMLPLSNIADVRFDDFAFARQFLEKEDVVTIPGSGFGTQGEGYLRIAYTASISDLEKAFLRLNAFYPSFITD